MAKTHTRVSGMHTPSKNIFMRTHFPCTFLVIDLYTHPVKWRGAFIPPGKVRSFRVQLPSSTNIHGGIQLAGKWAILMAGKSRNVRETKGHIPPLQRKQTWEQRPGAKRCFIALETTGKRGNKTCLCAHTFCANFGVHSEVVDTATSVFASKWALFSQHVCPMKSEWLSCLYFP